MTRPLAAPGSKSANRGAVTADDGRERVHDVRGHVVGGRELRERVREVEEGARRAGLSAGIVERRGGVERGGGETRVRLQHDAFLREEHAVRIDGGESSVTPLGGEHIDHDAVLVVVVVEVEVGREELDGESFRGRVSSMPLA